MIEDNNTVTPIIEITEPRKVKTTMGAKFPNGLTTYYDYSVSHLIYKGKDLGTMEDIKSNLQKLNEVTDISIFQAKMIEKLVNKDKLTKQDKEYFSHFERRDK